MAADGLRFRHLDSQTEVAPGQPARVRLGMTAANLSASQPEKTIQARLGRLSRSLYDRGPTITMGFVNQTLIPNQSQPVLMVRSGRWVSLGRSMNWWECW
jgi:hypothetical protein